MRRFSAAAADERWAFRCFVVVVLVALPCLVFLLGDHRWFHGDDWTFLFGRNARSIDDLFRPSNSHWSTVPIIVFRALYATVGLRAYWPYQLVVVSLHLMAACLLRALMRNSGVHPWIATAAATAFVFYGAGYANVIWAFQIGFTGCLAFGLAQLWLADHDGPIDVRDWLALVAGLVALMSAGLSIILIATVGLAMLLRRGWKVALFQTVPLAVVFVVWASITHPDNSGPLGYPDVDVIIRWLMTSSTGMFLSLGGSLLVAWILFGFAVAGTTWAWWDRDLSVRAAVPTAMAVGGLAFIATACAGRWSLGIDASRGSRFLHVIAAFLLPSIALGGTVVSTRLARRLPRAGRIAVPAVSILLLLGIPAGLDDYSAKPFHAQYYEAQKRILLNVTRVPEAHQVPRDVRPIPDPYRGRFVEIGYLNDAARAGKLPVRHEPLTKELREEMKVRLGVRQDPDSVAGFGVEPCPTRNGPLQLPPGTDELRITSPVVIRTTSGDRPLFRGVKFVPFAGTDLSIELDDLELQLVAPEGSRTLQVCLPG